jgi:flagellar capping protein FliD
LLLEQRRQRYTKQFLAMEKLIAGFKSQGDAMTGFVNALTRNNNS